MINKAANVKSMNIMVSDLMVKFMVIVDLINRTTEQGYYRYTVQKKPGYLNKRHTPLQPPAKHEVGWK